MDEQVKIPAHLVQGAQAAIDQLFEQLQGVQALVVASVDGFAVASRARVAVDANKIAAMASSFSALGLVVAEESQLGAKKAVTLEAEGGYVVLLDIARPDYPLVLIITTTSQAVLAQTLYLARACITEIAQV